MNGGDLMVLCSVNTCLQCTWSTGKKTPGGAGTHRNADHTEAHQGHKPIPQPHSTIPRPTKAHTHNRATPDEPGADRASGAHRTPRAAPRYRERNSERSVTKFEKLSKRPPRLSFRRFRVVYAFAVPRDADARATDPAKPHTTPSEPDPAASRSQSASPRLLERSTGTVQNR